MPSPQKIQRSRALRRHMPPAEKAVWWHLRSPLFKPYHFRRQAPLGPYFADFISHRMNLVIEIDGDTHTPEKDGARDAWFADRGYETLRIPNSDVYDDVDGIMETILARLRHIEQTRALQNSGPAPQYNRSPPHECGGHEDQQSHCDCPNDGWGTSP